MEGNCAGPISGDRHYTLVCSLCGKRQDDDGLILDCPADHRPSLLRSEYQDSPFTPRPGSAGVFRYRDWLPVIRTCGGSGRTVVYRSAALGQALGLPNLWIAFNGYWPERGACLETGTFKDLEADTVLGRLPERPVVLTVASSGNTGAAFAWACSREGTPCLLIIPGNGLSRFRFRAPLQPWVSLVCIEDGDYPDAITLAAAVSRRPPFQAEGGVKNVGRRDGLATVLLSAFEEMGCLPTHYFQAAGSGTGAIAVLEAARRIGPSLGEGVSPPRLMLCQNRPFTPIYDAWHGARDGNGQHDTTERYRAAIAHVYADELTNWTPPYDINGGVYDSLVGSRGDVLTADNRAIRTAMDMFLGLEGIDIEPAAGVAVACLRDAVSARQVGKESVILLNVTGGGRARLSQDKSLVSVSPQLRLPRRLLGEEATLRRIRALPAALASQRS